MFKKLQGQFEVFLLVTFLISQITLGIWIIKHFKLNVFDIVGLISAWLFVFNVIGRFNHMYSSIFEIAKFSNSKIEGQFESLKIDVDLSRDQLMDIDRKLELALLKLQTVSNNQRAA